MRMPGGLAARIVGNWKRAKTGLEWWAKLPARHNVDKMIVGSGIDLVEIHRIRQSVDRFGARFLNKVYTAAEQAYCLRKRNSAESLAARFAAKEAAAKALGTGMSRGVTWLEIEVVREPGGRPTLRLHGRAAEMARRIDARRASLSITHTSDLAMANVILEDGPGGEGAGAEGF
jgi:holo-[acyl-carrier protein] synthase